MDIFCINLERSPKRKEKMQKQFTELNLKNIYWVEAVDGKLLSHEERESHCNITFQQRAHKRIFFAGEIGCVLSHHKAYLEIINNDLKHGLILEDDTILPTDIKQKLDILEGEISKDKPQILLLSRIKQCFREPRKNFGDFEIVEMARGRGALAYIVNEQAAKLLLSTNTPIRYVADDWKRAWYFSNKTLKLLATLPKIVTFDDEGQSDIAVSDEEKNYRLTKRKPRTIKASLVNLPLKFQLWLSQRFRKVDNCRQL